MIVRRLRCTEYNSQREPRSDHPKRRRAPHSRAEATNEPINE
jgi:hypothetical protein